MCTMCQIYNVFINCMDIARSTHSVLAYTNILPVKLSFIALDVFYCTKSYSATNHQRHELLKNIYSCYHHQSWSILITFLSLTGELFRPLPWKPEQQLYATVMCNFLRNFNVQDPSMVLGSYKSTLNSNQKHFLYCFVFLKCYQLKFS